MLSRQARTIASRVSAQPGACSSRAPLLRTYASPAAAQDPKPPVAVYGLDGTYASALVREIQLLHLRLILPHL